MAEETSDIKPWTIRGVPPEERNAAIEAAKRSDMTLGEWLQRAIRTEIQQERQASKVPVAVGQPVSDDAAKLSDVERIATKLAELSAAGITVSKGHAAKITAALVAALPPSVRHRHPRPSDTASDLSDTPPE